MGGLQDFLILVTFLLEAAVLFYIEKKAWHTYYTPLNFLLIPYTIVLIITIVVTNCNYGFVEFYYPSIIIWNIGLLLFAIPSIVLSYFFSKNNINLNVEHKSCSIQKMLIIASFILGLLFLVHFISFRGSSVLGSSEFSQGFSGGGLWGHLRIFTIALLIMLIYFVERKYWWMSIMILVFLLVGLANNVKGWIIIPVLSGVFLRLYTGKMKLSIRLFLIVFLGGILLFFVSYGLAIIIAFGREFDMNFFDFIIGHFFHYLTSGVLGLSMDAYYNFPDMGNFETLWSPVINVIYVIIGEDNFVNQVNPLYFNSGLNVTNVRTFFGTIYIYTDTIEFVFYILLSSTLMYCLKLAIVKWNNIYMYTIYFFECGLLAMGWFEFYYFHLIVFELPVLVLLLWFTDWLIFSKERSPNEICCEKEAS
ncbi:MAG: oligosaccharide repeat unit polymerase [Bacteroidaceae bacterium]|nr:oligosaccharide repeat unit polymerase [Bacteroidaceae bacterium]